MNIVIAGPGALGRWLAAGLSSCTGDNDSLLLLDHRQNRADHLAHSGFLLQNGEETAVRYFVRTTTEPAAVRGCDLLFLCTRTMDVASCLDRLRPNLSPHTIIIFMQRGVRHVEEILYSGSAAAVSSADLFFGADDTLICNNPGSMQIGGLDTEAPTEKIEGIVSLLRQAGMEARQSDDIRRAAWDRFCFDAAVNPLAAIYRRPNGQLLTSCSVRGNLKKFLGEVRAVAEALGIGLHGDPVKNVFQQLRRDKDSIAPMLRDVRQKRATEIDSLCGYISQKGCTVAVPTPVSDDFLKRVQTIEAGYDAY